MFRIISIFVLALVLSSAQAMSKDWKKEDMDKVTNVCMETRINGKQATSAICNCVVVHGDINAIEPHNVIGWLYEVDQRSIRKTGKINKIMEECLKLKK